MEGVSYSHCVIHCDNLATSATFAAFASVKGRKLDVLVLPRGRFLEPRVRALKVVLPSAWRWCVLHSVCGLCLLCVIVRLRA